MKKGRAFMNRLGVAVALLSASVGIAAENPLLEDARNLATVYQGTLEIDSSNSTGIWLETLLPNQWVELTLKGSPLNTTAVRALSLPGSLRLSGLCSGGGRTLDCPTPEVSPVNFNDFRVYVDGCNISGALVQRCNEANGGAGCWAVSGGTHEPSMLSMGGQFSFGQSIVLSNLNVSCGSGGFKNFDVDKKYRVEFKELNSGSGGRLDYQIVLRNKDTLTTLTTRK